MSKKVRLISEVIAELQEYPQSEMIAVNWWLESDFEEEYKDVKEALQLTQNYLNGLNPELTSFVDDYYEGERN